MSLNNKKVSSRYQEKTLVGESSLILSQNLLDQIDHLHEIVGAVEWSGVLVYKILEGSIEDHESLVIEALEILPMDVGTSGYTEYELDSSDEYTFNNLCDRVMMDPDLKIGHIHTHHNMQCFFSGTDTQELHDNAPNHNYYLSLIVNFKKPEHWCAKIAMVGTEKSEGKVTRSFKGTNGIVEFEQDLTHEAEMLYLIDMDIDVSAVLRVTDEFATRVSELNKKKGRAFTSTYIPGYHAAQNSQWGGSAKTVSVGKQTALFPELTTGQNIGGNREAKPNIQIDMSSQSIEDFANKLLSQSTLLSASMHSCLSVLQTAFDSEEVDVQLQKIMYLDNLYDVYDTIFLDHFQTSPTDISRELIAKKVVACLEVYKKEFTFLEEVIEEITTCFIFEEV